MQQGWNYTEKALAMEGWQQQAVGADKAQDQQCPAEDAPAEQAKEPLKVPALPPPRAGGSLQQASSALSHLFHLLSLLPSNTQWLKHHYTHILEVLSLFLSSILLFKLGYGERGREKSENAKQALILHPIRMKSLSKLNNRYKNLTALPCRINQLFQSCPGFPSASLGTFVCSGKHRCMCLCKCVLLQHSVLKRQILVASEKTVI